MLLARVLPLSVLGASVVGSQPAKTIPTDSRAATPPDLAVTAPEPGRTAPPPCTKAWHWVSPRPFGNDLYDAAWAPDIGWVAVGRAGAVATSPDGISWTGRHSGTTEDINAVTWGGGQFVAVGRREQTGSPLILTSPDGISWTARDRPGLVTIQEPLIAVVWNGAEYLAMDATGRYLRSADAVTWAVPFSPLWLHVSDLAWVDDRWIAVGKRKSDPWVGVIFESANAVNWTRVFEGGFDFMRVVGSGTTAVAVGRNIVATSTAGGPWAATYEPPDFDVRHLARTGGRFLAIGETRTACASAVAIESLDGSFWNREPIQGFPSQTLRLRTGDDDLLVVGYSGLLASSGDGTSWLESRDTVPVRFQDLVWGGGRFAGIEGDGTVWVSSDGFAWQKTGELPPAGAMWESIAWGYDRYVAVGPFIAAFSQDAVHWSTAVVGPVAGLREVVWDGGRFVAFGWEQVGDSLRSAVAASNDGTSWERIDNGSAPFATRLRALASAYYLMGDPTAPLVSSPDGVAWTTVELPQEWSSDGIATDIATDGRRLVLGGAQQWCCIGYCAQQMLVSDDRGHSWQMTDPLPAVSELLWDEEGRRFLAVGEPGWIGSSPDGLTWTTEWPSVAVNVHLGQLAVGDGTIVAAGTNGVVAETCDPDRPPRRRASGQR